MPRLVTIVDYGIGNIFSVTRAIEHFGASVLLTDKPSDIANAETLVLPGVGAFYNGMQGLWDRGLVEPLRSYAKSGRPLLGICLGMQMLFTTSTEFGDHEGLGIIEGVIESVETPLDAAGVSMKIPHIGWSELEYPKGRANWEGSILDGVLPGENCYFVHSFTAVPAHAGNRLADTHYGSSLISAAVQKDNVYGCQFHPEKSGSVGLKIIRGFLEVPFV
jgi:glutamine amidotransferase